MLLKSVSTKVIRCYPMENNVIFIFEIRKRSLFIGGGGGGGTEEKRVGYTKFCVSK